LLECIDVRAGSCIEESLHRQFGTDSLCCIHQLTTPFDARAQRHAVGSRRAREPLVERA
jgi:hypothetical protein